MKKKLNDENKKDENKIEGENKNEILNHTIASRKDFSRDKEDDYNIYYPDQKSRKYYIEKRATLIHLSLTKKNIIKIKMEIFYLRKYILLIVIFTIKLIYINLGLREKDI